MYPLCFVFHDRSFLTMSCYHFGPLTIPGTDNTQAPHKMNETKTAELYRYHFLFQIGRRLRFVRVDPSPEGFRWWRIHRVRRIQVGGDPMWRRRKAIHERVPATHECLLLGREKTQRLFSVHRLTEIIKILSKIGLKVVAFLCTVNLL